jgi:tetratricopeptide (TPR) repeat protein
MSSSTPIVKQISWKAIPARLPLLLVIMLICSLFNSQVAIIVGVISYITITTVVPRLAALTINKGIKLVRQEKFQEAIPYFEHSYDFYERNSWIDKYRFLVVFSSSKISYREINLCNIAFCYGQLQQKEKCIEAYQRALQHFQDSSLAKSALRVLEAKE